MNFAVTTLIIIKNIQKSKLRKNVKFNVNVEYTYIHTYFFLDYFTIINHKTIQCNPVIGREEPNKLVHSNRNLPSIKKLPFL